MALAVTGVAGPAASERKPAGLLFIACAVVGVATTVVRHDFAGTRAAVRAQTVDAALRLGQRRAAATPV